MLDFAVADSTAISQFLTNATLVIGCLRKPEQLLTAGGKQVRR